jgi:putative DNA primase/helicase
VRLIPFEVTIPESDRDPELHDKLMAEAEGILAWLIEGALLAQAEGLEPAPAAVMVATEDYREEMDPMSDWLEEATDMSDPEAWTPNGELRESYEAHAATNGYAGISFAGKTCPTLPTLTDPTWAATRT